MGTGSAYVRNAWYVAAWSHQLAAEQPLAVSILGEPIVLWRAQGVVHAFEDRCVHRFAPLSLGRCEGHQLRCMYHGFLFDGAGTVVQIPGQDVIPPRAKVKTYRVQERHSWIWVWMGDLAQADESLIPPAVGLDEPDWLLGSGHLDYAAEARLINDNLLDFSHLTFVHAKSFGAGSEFADERPRISALDRGIRFERWIVGSTEIIGGQSSELVDRWGAYDFLVPGVLLMWSGSFKAGTAAACNYERPDYDQALSGVTFTSQAVTPTGDKTARYFFSWGPHRLHGDEKMRDLLMGIAEMAFAEDKCIIEAQQATIDRFPAATIIPTVHDRGVTQFEKLVARLIRQEAAGPPASGGVPAPDDGPMLQA